MGFDQAKELEFKKRLHESLSKIIKTDAPQDLTIVKNALVTIHGELDKELANSDVPSEQAVAPKVTNFSEYHARAMSILSVGKGKLKTAGIVVALEQAVDIKEYKVYCNESPAAQILRERHLLTFERLWGMAIPQKFGNTVAAKKVLLELQTDFAEKGYFDIPKVIEKLRAARELATKDSKFPECANFLSELTLLPLNSFSSLAAALDTKQKQLSRLEEQYEGLLGHMRRLTSELARMVVTQHDATDKQSIPALMQQLQERLKSEETTLTQLEGEIKKEKEEKARLELLEKEAREALAKKEVEEAKKRAELEKQKEVLESQVKKRTEQLHASRREAQEWKEKFDEISEVVEASEDGRTKTLIRDVRNGTVTSTRKKDLASLKPFVGGDKLKVMESLSGFTRTLALNPEETLRLEKQILRIYFSSPNQSAKEVLGDDKRWKKYSEKKLNGHYQFLANAFDGVKPWLSSAVEPKADTIVDMDARAMAMRKLIGKEGGIFKQLTIEKFDYFLGKRQLSQLAPMLNPDIVTVLQIMHRGSSVLTKTGDHHTGEKRMLEICRLNSTDSVKEYLETKCPYYKGYKDGQFVQRKIGFLEPIYAKIDTFIRGKEYQGVLGIENAAVEKAQSIQGLIGKSGLFSRCKSEDLHKNFGKLLAAQVADEASTSSGHVSVVHNN